LRGRCIFLDIVEDDQDQCAPVTVWTIKKNLDELAPPELAEEWDHIGLQVGEPSQLVRKVLICLDVTMKTAAEALDRECQLIISHHPLIFNPLPEMRLDCPEQAIIGRLIAQSQSVLVAHTNFDAASGGVADCLAEALHLSRETLQPVGRFGRLGQLKPARTLSQLLAFVRESLGSAGCRLNTDQDRPVSRMAVFPGSFPEEDLDELVLSQAELVVCGEIKHHAGLMLAARGIACIDAGHDVTERIALYPLADRLAVRLPQIEFAVARDMHYNEIAF
jgi:dinuclear metal center YbgI/SA1388 family protein